jgi:hypothetical protein
VAGPSIAVRVLGDVSGLAKSIQGAGKAASGAAAGLHQAFSGVLSTLNSTGVLGPFGDALAGVNASIEGIGKHAKSVGPALLGIGGAAAAAGVGLAAVGSKDQAAHQQLQASIEATGKSYDDYGKQVEGAIKHQERFGDTANQTQDALRVLTQATGDPAKALTLLSTATDLAAAKHEDLATASTQLGKVYNGNAKLLKEFGIQVTSTTKLQAQATTAQKQAVSADNGLATARRKLADLQLIDNTRGKLTLAQQIALRNAQRAVTDATVKAQDAHRKLSAAQKAAGDSAKGQGSAVTELAAKLHGQASAAADTFGGKLAAVKARVEDAAASFGQKYGPAITAAGSATAVLGGGITAAKGVLETFSKGAKTAEAATKGVGEAEKGAQAASSLLAGASGIGLVLLAVAALVAIGYVLYKNWDTIWSGIKRIVKVVWDWIKANWPLLLGILLGPIALAAALIWKHWGSILAGIQGVWRWITANWPLLLAILTGPIGLAVRWIIQNWGAITRFFSSILSWFATTWQTVSSSITAPFVAAWKWLSGLPALIIGLFKGASTWLRQAGKDIANGLWNGITSVFSDIAGWIKAHVADPIINAVKHFFGIKSPSSVMAGIGQQLLAGLMKGLSPGNWLDFAKTVFGSMPSALAHLIGGAFVDIARVPGKVLSSIGGALGDALGSIGGFFGGIFGGGHKSGLNDWINAAMRITGVSALWAGPLKTIIQHESGGNPKAINLTDINAQRGDPSRGLMQTIGATFAAYALPGFNKNIFDPVSNVIAGIRYIIARYGDILNVPGIASLLRGGAYVGYDGGGLLHPGLTLALNKTGADEYVSRMPPGGRSGPAVVIQNANFATELDVDAFMRRAAWVVRTKAV